MVKSWLWWTLGSVCATVFVCGCSHKDDSPPMQTKYGAPVSMNQLQSNDAAPMTPADTTSKPATR